MIAVGVRVERELLQKQRIFENPLNWFDQIGFEGRRMLMTRISCGEEIFQMLIVLMHVQETIDSQMHRTEGGIQLEVLRIGEKGLGDRDENILERISVPRSSFPQKRKATYAELMDSIVSEDLRGNIRFQTFEKRQL